MGKDSPHERRHKRDIQLLGNLGQTINIKAVNALDAHIFHIRKSLSELVDEDARGFVFGPETCQDDFARGILDVRFVREFIWNWDDFCLEGDDLRCDGVARHCEGLDMGRSPGAPGPDDKVD